MDREKRVFGYIGLTVTILLLLYIIYAYEQGSNLLPVETNLWNDEVKIERKIKIPEGKTKEFILPAFLVGLYHSSTGTIGDSIEGLEDGNEDHSWFEKLEDNGDGTLTMSVTGKQLERWISTREHAINTRIENNREKNMEIKIKKDYTKVTYIMKEGYETSFMGWGMDAQVILGSLFEAQVFTGVAQEDCYVREVVKRETDGKVIIDTDSQNRYFEITDAEWYGSGETE
ncbi:hypothetical protein [Dorea sp. D27]|uniref:hypothetical protein n=1 Tax=Dorea sp. D27 TaxID=658665 RepID=UPI0006734FCD|nr:hypothetical protein [Dorea sp. D27]KMZ52830.1 hypothetical protein HMPREF0980_03054 [Dorea sp. D27]